MGGDESTGMGWDGMGVQNWEVKEG
jgi:hypothetical protein